MKNVDLGYRINGMHLDLIHEESLQGSLLQTWLHEKVQSDRSTRFRVKTNNRFSVPGVITFLRIVRFRLIGGFSLTPRTGLLFGLKWSIIFNPPNMTPWRCRTTVFCKHPRDQLAKDESSTDLNKTDAFRKVIKCTRMSSFGFSKSVQVPLRLTKKILFHFKSSVLYYVTRGEKQWYRTR